MLAYMFDQKKTKSKISFPIQFFQTFKRDLLDKVFWLGQTR